jgi:hypothetical protein
VNAPREDGLGRVSVRDGIGPGVAPLCRSTTEYTSAYSTNDRAATCRYTYQPMRLCCREYSLVRREVHGKLG